MSGLNGSPGKTVYRKVPRVRIPPSPRWPLWYIEFMVDSETSLGVPGKIRKIRLGFALAALACFLLAFLTFVISLRGGNVAVLFLILGLLGCGILCGIVVGILNGKERKAHGAAVHSSAFGSSMGIILVMFLGALALMVWFFFKWMGALS